MLVAPFRLVTQGESHADELPVFDLVDDRQGEVFVRQAHAAVGRDDGVLETRAVVPRAHPWREIARRRRVNRVARMRKAHSKGGCPVVAGAGMLYLTRADPTRAPNTP